jgi:ABC-type transport system involved in multi-copper enzyme maturation permease subunit
MTGGDGFIQVLRGEWTKFRSVRSTAWCVVLGIGLMVLISALGASGSHTNANEGPKGPIIADQFHFVHQPLAGDGTITARAVSQEDTGPWARAGIMIKDGVQSGSPYAAMMVTPGHGVRLQANFTTDVAGSRSRTPRWLRLTRAGNTITAYEGDGTTWTPVGTVTMTALPQAAEVGLFVTSPSTKNRVIRQGGSTRTGADWRLSTATFDNVTVAAPSGGRPVVWRDEDVGGPVQQVDDSALAGSATQSGGTFTVRGAGNIASVPRQYGGDDDMVRNALSGVYIGLIAIATLGVLFATSEYKTGIVRTTFAASPRRSRVLAAKAVIVGATTFAVGLVASVAALYLALPVMRGNGYRPPAYPTPSLSDGPVLRAVVGTALVVAVLALIGLGLGTILRRSAGPVTLVIAAIVVPSIVSGLLPFSVEKWLQRLTPLAGLAIQQTRDRFDNYIGPWAGFGVLCAYAAVILGAAFWMLRRRDA